MQHYRLRAVEIFGRLILVAINLTSTSTDSDLKLDRVFAGLGIGKQTVASTRRWCTVIMCCWCVVAPV